MVVLGTLHHIAATETIFAPPARLVSVSSSSFRTPPQTTDAAATRQPSANDLVPLLHGSRYVRGHQRLHFVITGHFAGPTLTMLFIDPLGHSHRLVASNAGAE